MPEISDPAVVIICLIAALNFAVLFAMTLHLKNVKIRNKILMHRAKRAADECRITAARLRYEARTNKEWLQGFSRLLKSMSPRSIDAQETDSEFPEFLYGRPYKKPAQEFDKTEV